MLFGKVDAVVRNIWVKRYFCRELDCLFHRHFSCTLWGVKSSWWEVVASLAQRRFPVLPFASLALHHVLLTLGLCDSAQRNGVKKITGHIWPAQPTLERHWRWAGPSLAFGVGSGFAGQAFCKRSSHEEPHVRRFPPLHQLRFGFSIFFANFSAVYY